MMFGLIKTVKKTIDSAFGYHTAMDGTRYTIDAKGTRHRRDPKVRGKANVKRHKKARQ